MPKKAAGAGRNSTFNMRVTDDLRDRLQKAADDSGRALSREIEHRLEQSFRPSIEEMLGGPGNALLANAVAFAASVVQDETGKDWRSDAGTRQLVFHACRRVLRAGLLNSDTEPAESDNERLAAATIAKDCATVLSRPGMGDRFPEETIIRQLHDMDLWKMLRERSLSA